MRSALFMLFALMAMTSWAQEQKQDTTQVKQEKKERKLYLYGYLSDSFTRSYIPDSKVVLLRPDSTLVDSAHVDNSGYDGFKSSTYYLQVPAKPARYIIKATAPDYETTYKNYEIKYVARNRSFEVPAIRMKRTQRVYEKDGGELDEVVVKATKVKMVYKGDTIVFNADAFNIPEGSMLDGLIKQLPGVELKDDGEIFVNGKKVENLTLNGADFFKGKNKMMLENLPYYTVKNVQVFDKRTPKSEFLGRDVEEKEFTMDVQLKREYSVGGTVNLEAGASPGPSEGGEWRYKLRGFGLRYTDQTRAVLFGGMNNLNGRYIENGLLDYLLKEREAGRIRNLGFSYHGDIEVFDHLLAQNDKYHWDFVQIELNYLDWNYANEINSRNTDASYLYAELQKLNIPAVIMEPLLGGRLANLPQYLVKELKTRNPEKSVASWAFRYAGTPEGVLTVLSGMTYMEHLKDNLLSYCPLEPLSKEEQQYLDTEIAKQIVGVENIPCNDCKYCMPCPYGIDIPAIFVHYNKCKNEGTLPQDMQDENYWKNRRQYLISLDRSVPRERQPDHCIQCGQCEPHCPQNIRIPRELAKIDKYIESLKNPRPAEEGQEKA